MARNGTYSKTIEKYFRDNPSKVVDVGDLMKVANCGKPSVSSAISYLNKKNAEGKGGLHIVTLVRGKSWQYNPSASNQPPKVSERTTARITPAMRELAKKSVPDWADAEQAFLRDQTHQVIRLVLVGTSTEGHAIGKDEDTGNVFKVVPV